MALASGIASRARMAFGVAAGCAFAALLAGVVLSVQFSGDYNIHDPVGGDNAAPGIAALLHGSLAGYLQHQPIIGLTSVLLRLPAVAVASQLGAGALLTYKVGALACVLPLALLGGWILSERSLSPTHCVIGLFAILVVIESPVLRNALESGHPEDVLAQVLAVGAVVLAIRARARSAALLLGLTIAAKESELIAVLPVMIALPRRRREVTLITGGVVLLLVCAPWIGDPSALLRALHGEGHTRFLTPLSVLWPLGSAEPLANGQLSLAHIMPWGLTRTTATILTLGATAIPGAWWFFQRRRAGATCSPLALLALLGVLRCFCDSTHELYYYTSVLIPLVAWEVFENRVPLLTLLVSLGVSWLYGAVGRVPAVDVYLLCGGGQLILASYLASRAMVARQPVSLSCGGARLPMFRA
jgi:hypothetical protein